MDWDAHQSGFLPQRFFAKQLDTILIKSIGWVLKESVRMCVPRMCVYELGKHEILKFYTWNTFFISEIAFHSQEVPYSFYNPGL